MKSLVQWLVLASLLFVLGGCAKEDEPSLARRSNPTSGEEDEFLDEFALIDPSDANALSRVLNIEGARRVLGNLPITVTRQQLRRLIESVVSSNGSTALLTFRADPNLLSSLSGYYAQVEGANEYFDIPRQSILQNGENITLPVGIPTNVSEGNFCMNLSARGNGGVSNPAKTCVNVLRLGTGALQISLSWNTSTDQDLHVTDPDGTLIYYRSPSSPSGGELDRDDLDGYGPENIFWTSNALDGAYTVEVHDYNGTPGPNAFYVTVSNSGESRSYTGSTRNGRKVLVVRFTKSGNRLSSFTQGAGISQGNNSANSPSQGTQGGNTE